MSEMRKVLILGLFGRFWVAFWVIRPYVFQVCFSAAAPGPLDLSQISLKLYQTEELKYRAGGGCSYTNRVKNMRFFNFGSLCARIFSPCSFVCVGAHT